MMNDFISANEPVVVTTFGHCEVDGNGNKQCDRIFYIIKLENEDRFLNQAYRPLWKKSWTTKLTRLCLWNTPESAMEFAQKHFNNVKDDTL